MLSYIKKYRNINKWVHFYCGGLDLNSAQISNLLLSSLDSETFEKPIKHAKPQKFADLKLEQI